MTNDTLAFLQTYISIVVFLVYVERNPRLFVGKGSGAQGTYMYHRHFLQYSLLHQEEPAEDTCAIAVPKPQSCATFCIFHLVLPLTRVLGGEISQLFPVSFGGRCEPRPTPFQNHSKPVGRMQDHGSASPCTLDSVFRPVHRLGAASKRAMS